MSAALKITKPERVYLLRWRRPGGEWIKEGFPTHNDAKRRLRQLNGIAGVEAQTAGLRNGIYLSNWS